MNSCDKSSAFSLDPLLKAVSYFIFKVCMPLHEAKFFFSIPHCYIYTIYVAPLKKWNGFTFLRTPNSDTKVFDSK